MASIKRLKAPLILLDKFGLRKDFEKGAVGQIRTLTYEFRVRLLGISHNPWSPLSHRIRKISRLLGRKMLSKTLTVTSVRKGGLKTCGAVMGMGSISSVTSMELLRIWSHRKKTVRFVTH